LRRRAVLIYNPRAGGHRGEARAPLLVDALAAAGFAAQALPTDSPGHAAYLARAAVAMGAEVVFGLGGDGTLREVAAGLIDSPAALGILPGGTANVVARAFAIPLGALAAAKAARDFAPRQIDVGMCGGRIFLMQASTGLDAHVLTRLNLVWKRRFGRAGVAAQGLRGWWDYDYPELEVEADGRRHRASFAALCNLPHYGGDFRLAPDARPDDGRLDLVLFHGRGRAATLAFGLDLVAGRHAGRRDVEILRVEHVRFLAPETAPLQLDGDPRALAWPLEARVAPHRLTVLAPAGVAASPC
jgi:diacylglycerol kinase (ATP)